MRRLLPILLLAASALAQSPTYSLSGKVINSATGEPIPHALVQIYGNVLRAAMTDDFGAFSFSDLPAGRGTIQFRKPGYFSSLELQQLPPRSVEIGPDTPPLTLELVPEAVISGHVESGNGQPLEQVTVRLLGSEIQNGRRIVAPRNSAQTDDNGDYRMANLRPGTYFVMAGGGRDMPQGLPSQGARQEVFPAAVFYPGVSEFSAANPLALAPGQQARADFTLNRVRAYRVSGKLMGAPQGGGVNFSFSLGPHSDANVEYRFDSRTGAFEAPHVPAGRYLVTVEAQDGAAQAYFAQASVEVAGNISGLNLALSPELPIPVIERDDFSPDRQSNAGSIMIGLRSSEESPHVGFQFTDSNGRVFGNAEMSGPPGAKTTRITRVRPGTYTVDIFPNGPWYVAAAYSGSTDLLRDPLTIVPGVAPQPIEVTLRDDGARIEGTLDLSSPDEVAHILLVSNAQAMQRPMQVMIVGGRNHIFNFSNVPPGDYTLLAFDSVAELEFRNPAVISDYLAKGTAVSVNPGSNARVSVTLIRRNQ